MARAGDLRGIWLNALGRIGKPSHASLHRLKYLRYYGSSHPGTLYNTLNTSYADPPKMQMRWSVKREIHCGAVLLAPFTRSRSAS